MKTISQILFIGLFALITFTNNVSAKETKLKVASCHEDAIEAKLEMENWMLEESYWDVSQTAIF